MTIYLAMYEKFFDENFYLTNNFAAERQLIQDIRTKLINIRQGNKPGELVIPTGLTFAFDPSYSQIYITLYQESEGKIRWGSRRITLQDTLIRNIEKIAQNKHFARFTIEDESKCRILLEVVIEENLLNDINDLVENKISKYRFEPGITGLRLIHNGLSHYYMPTDAVTNNHMTINHALNHMSKKIHVAKLTNKISERVKLMKAKGYQYFVIKSCAFVSYENEVLPLFRGCPVPIKINREVICESMLSGCDWLINNMKKDGQFLYYYEGIGDTIIDFQHPNMIDPPYYNILRHSGGTITLLRAYEHTNNNKYLHAAKSSLDFLITTLRTHPYNGHEAYYVFFEKNKAKLGGSGIGLVALMHYWILSGDSSYNKFIDGLARHLLSRITPDGEMLGYYIHPLYNDGMPIENPTEEEKEKLFSFYYPGEALLGLALYYKHASYISQEMKDEIEEKSDSALEFLINIRPIKYKHLFMELPADGWLMQAIEEWASIDKFKKKHYIDFVFNDAQAMIDHMYRDDDALFYDYIGCFYYVYGDHPYPDGSRCEGLIAAYFLAKQLGDSERAKYILSFCMSAAKALLYTYNSKQYLYAHKYPHKSLGAFRFKLTRQWVRVDSVQHTACFYARLVTAIEDQ